MTANAMPVTLDTPVQYLKGVGPQRGTLLEKAGIQTASDLLRYVPFRYEDRSQFRPIRSLREGEDAVVCGRILVSGGYTTSVSRTRIFEAIVRDDSGAMSIKFFNQPYLARILKNGEEGIFYGRPRYDRFQRALVLTNPEFEIISGEDVALHTGRIVPVYRRIGRLTTRMLRSIIFRLLERLDPNTPDILPEDLRSRLKLPGLLEAYSQVHFPVPPGGISRQDFLEALEQKRVPGFQRLIFEEFFTFQIGLALIRRHREVVEKAFRPEVDDAIRERARQVLPFRLTGAQKRALREIVGDLRRSSPMSRLLQGDVGSGKTIVAVLAALVVIENGFQVAIMAPTELLAEQHYRNVTRLLEGSGVEVSLLTGSVKGKERKRRRDAIASGRVNLIVGTHALIQESVDFDKLSLVIIDEQHRFGVVQRSQLMEKGSRPDTLVMTATPIPRSLALTAFGDLSVSVIDELPPGRRPVRTVIKTERSRDQVYAEVRRQLALGRQAYFVYPLIEESEKVDLKAATEASSHLAEDVVPEYRVGLMHSRLKPDKKEALMREFLEGSLHVLVSTTVIEVGIDVPNATLMIIEHAERFGLSQLHQLRGRIGRGRHPGLCILMVDRLTTREAGERLAIMRETNDGFKIAEKDLELRGPGEFVGTRQSGAPQFVVGNIVRDRGLLELAREEAFAFVGELERRGSPGRKEMARLLQLWRERYSLFEVG